MRILPYYRLTTLHLLIGLGPGMVQAVAFRFQLAQCNDQLIRGDGLLEHRVCAPHYGAGWLKVEDTRASSSPSEYARAAAADPECWDKW